MGFRSGLALYVVLLATVTTAEPRQVYTTQSADERLGQMFYNTRSYGVKDQELKFETVEAKIKSPIVFLKTQDAFPFMYPEPEDVLSVVVPEPKINYSVVDPEPKSELGSRSSLTFQDSLLKFNAKPKEKSMTVFMSNPRNGSTVEPGTTALVATRCSESFPTVHVSYGMIVSFESPRFPKRYPPKKNCGWEFKTDEGYALDLYCPRIDLKKRDYLHFSEKQFSITGFVDSIRRSSLYYYFWGNEVTVGFQSNSKGSARGFKCIVWPVSLRAQTPTTTVNPATTTVNPATTTSTAAPTNTTDCLCGLKGPADRIVGGQDATQFEYPWMVSLGVGLNQFCGGTLISDTWIVTAAHCVTRGSSITVGLGYYDKYNSDHYTLKRSVRQIERHRDYNNGTPMDNDIALLRIDSIEWAKYPQIRPVCLPDTTSEQYVGEIGTITGWGTTSYGGQDSDILQEVDIPIISNDKCANVYDITDNMICATQPEGGLDSCQGDSGGPMIVQDGGNNELVGIVSFGYKCAEKGYPGVYTRVTQYLSWINKITGNNGYCLRSTSEPTSPTSPTGSTPPTSPTSSTYTPLPIGITPSGLPTVSTTAPTTAPSL